MEASMPVQPAPARSAVSAHPILVRETVGSIAVLTMNRPAARNSLSEALIGELHAAISDIKHEDSVRAVVIAANGPAFSAGHDMKELTARRSDPDHGRAYFSQMMHSCCTMMQAVVHLPKPVVAAVQGIATAAGCQLVASCDLAIASEAASFATPGVDIGLFCSTPMVALSRNVPRKLAMEMLLTGEPISAAKARELRPRKPGCPRGQRTRCCDRASSTGRAKIRLHSENRQGRVLSSGRNEPCRSLSLHGRSHD